MIGRIYKISGGDKFYIGSTTQTLSMRLKNHRSKSKEYSRKDTPLYKHFNHIGWSSCSIELLVEDKFENKKALFETENVYICKHIGNQQCLNHSRPTITKEEKQQRDQIYGKKHREENKESDYQRVVEWRKNNPEKYAEQVKRSVEQQRIKRELNK